MVNCRDPPNMSMCMQQLNKHSESKKDSLRLFLYHVIRGTNLTELHYKSLLSAHRT